ncbi:hypothetical protein [Cellulomonas sp. NPDC058312]|uniref:beta family protein n=1 Tax=Cellulomonas sp. NPDC058312 TaxID=3346441 RepID=UPI0036EBF25E
MYVPVLKVREAETDALSAWAGRPLTPLFELVEHKDRGLASEMMFCLEQLRDAWTGPCFVDVAQLVATPPDRTFAWELADFWLRHQGITNVAPVVDPEDDAAVHTAAARTAALAQSAALRVDAESADPDLLDAAVTGTLTRLGISRDQIHLILDWRDAPTTRDLDSLEQESRALLAAAGGGWASVAVVGTAAGSAPTGTGAFERARREWWLWLRLSQNTAGLPQTVTYGDYAGFPAPQPGNGRASIPAIRYTGQMTTTIYRERNGTGRLGPTGTHKCAAAIASSAEFRGAAFSDGDRTIDDAAHDPDFTTNAAGWRRIALQHHLAQVDDQLVTPPTAPPAGTA